MQKFQLQPCQQFLELQELIFQSAVHLQFLLEWILRKQFFLLIQDLKKNILIRENREKNQAITPEQIVEKLLISLYKCYYCKREVQILYENTREPKQWTLERINNNEGHTYDNCVIACLECNLKRRRTNKDAFMFTKNLKIIREGI